MGDGQIVKIVSDKIGGISERGFIIDTIEAVAELKPTVTKEELTEIMFKVNPHFSGAVKEKAVTRINQYVTIRDSFLETSKK